MLQNYYYLNYILSSEERTELYQPRHIYIIINYQEKDREFHLFLLHNNKAYVYSKYRQNELISKIEKFIERMKKKNTNLEGVYGNIKGRIFEELCCKLLEDYFNYLNNKRKNIQTIPINQLVFPESYKLVGRKNKNCAFLYSNRTLVGEFDFAKEVIEKRNDEISLSRYLILIEIKSSKLTQNGKSNNLIKTLTNIAKKSSYKIRYLFFTPSPMPYMIQKQNIKYPPFIEEYYQYISSKFEHKNNIISSILLSINPILVFKNNNPAKADQVVRAILLNQFKNNPSILRYV